METQEEFWHFESDPKELAAWNHMKMGEHFKEKVAIVFYSNPKDI